MSHHSAKVVWHRNTDPFKGNAYSRAHHWHFDSGAVIAASASPLIVDAPWSVAEAIDPEEAFVASLSSCHMLWFLSLASAKGIVIDSYEDDADGLMAEIAPKRLAITEVTLRPLVALPSGSSTTREQLADLHEQAHERCFIAHSVRSTVRIEPR